MTISFSGLASGLDTSSWIKSLTALKQAKVTTLQEQKSALSVSKNTLNSIRSFFTSFRSTLEKVTDSRFNIASMNIFAQNLAMSAKPNIVTATATSEAKEGKYEVKVDKLASNTQAVSKNNYTKTVTRTEAANGNTTLKEIGLKRSGTIKINGEDFYINEDWTMDRLISELKDKGYHAEFNARTGVFSANFNANNIIDTDLTGIIEALHLSSVNKGYTSNDLTIEKVEKTETEAVLSTSIWAIKGINSAVKDIADEKEDHTDGDARTLTIEAGGEQYYVMLDSDETIESLMDAINTDVDLQSKGVSASFGGGVFKLINARVVADGQTNFIEAFGLENANVTQSQQQSAVIVGGNTTTTETATESTYLTALQGGTGITDSDTVVVEDDAGKETTISLRDDMTLGELLQAMRDAGLEASISEDGIVSISDGKITGGTVDIKSILGLTETVTGGGGAPVTTSTIGITLTSTEVITQTCGFTDVSGATALSEIADMQIQSGKTYAISTTADLQALAEIVNGGNNCAGATFVMTGNIDLSSIENWTAIGGDSNSFRGIFDGNGYEITGMNIDSTSDDQGLFGNIYGATIKNLGITGYEISGPARVGALAGQAENSTITNVYTEGTISATGTYVGGLVGCLYSGTITSCQASGTIESTSYGVGGLVGQGTATIVSSSSDANVVGTFNVGGIVGLGQGKYTSVYSSGTITATNSTDANKAGGIVGYISSGTTIQDSYTKATVSDGGGAIAGSVSSSGTLAITNSQALSNNYVAYANANTTTTNCSVLAAGETPFIINAQNAIQASVSATTLSSILDYQIKSGHTYKISTAADLQALAEIVNGGNNCAGATFVMTNNIDLSSIENWTAIGYSSYFKGIFDGNGYEITGLNIGSTSDSQGLFGAIENATIKNLGITGYEISGHSQVGALAGYAYNSTITNVYTEGTISATGISVGGLVGYLASGTITSCQASGTIESTSNTVGGLVGQGKCIIVSSSSDANVVGTYNVGGIVGGSGQGKYTSVYSSGTITATDSTKSNTAGGIVGWIISNATIQNSYTKATVSSGGGSIAGSVDSSRTTLAITNSQALSDNYVAAPNANTTTTNCSVLAADETPFTISAKKTVQATGATAFGQMGLESSALVTIVSNGTESVFTVETGTTLSQFQSHLQGKGFTTDFTNGILTISGANGVYIKGDLDDSIDAVLKFEDVDNCARVETSGSVGSTTITGSNQLFVSVAPVETTAEIDTKLGSFGINNTDTLIIKDAQGNTIYSGSNLEGKTIGEFLEFCSIQSTGSITGSFTDGVITFNSPSGCKIEGTIAEKLGLTTTGGAAPVTTSTIGITLTSTEVITYNQSGMTNTAGLTSLSSIADMQIQSGQTYAISTTADLQALAEIVNGGITCVGATFVMTGNIDLSSIENWTAIGNKSNSFQGIFDGNGYEITGMNIDSTSGYQGLFGKIYNATIKNLGITGYEISGDSHVGALAGVASYSTITNVYTEGTISATDLHVGGLVGSFSTGRITSCQASGTIESTSYYVGGLVGHGDGTIVSSSSDANVTGTYYVGGIVGSGDGKYISVYSSGTITATNSTKANTAGGIVGCITNNITIQSSYTKATVSSGGGAIAGSVRSSGTLAITNSQALSNNYVAYANANTTTTGCSVITADETPFIINAQNSVQASVSVTTLSSISDYQIKSGHTYKISTTADLQALAEIVNGGNSCSGVTFVMTGNIDLSSIENWTAIGNSSNSFRGTFDGNGYEITGLNIDSTSDYQSLFGYIENATIKNLGITGYEISGDTYVGALAGEAQDSTITNVYTEGTISATGSFVGGLVGGLTSSTITSCQASGTIESTSSEVGGLVGDNNGTIVSSSSDANVVGTDRVGGIVGSGYGSGKYISVYSSGTITATDSTKSNTAGGIVGYISSGQTTIQNSYTKATVSDGGGAIAGSVGSSSTLAITNSQALSDNYVAAPNANTKTNNCSVLAADDTPFTISAKKTAQATGATTFGQIGLESSALVTIVSNGTESVFTVETGTTLSQFQSHLQGKGFTTDFTNGILTISGANGVYIKGDLDDSIDAVLKFEDVDNCARVEITGGGAPITTSTIGITLTSTEVITQTCGFTDVSGLTALSSVTASDMVSGRTYKIATTDDLLQLATIVNGGTDCAGVTFVMANDIDLSSIENWTAIGDTSHAFKGTFDGSGYEITGLNIDSAHWQGLFGFIQNATIKNLGITGYEISGRAYVGALAGYAQNSTITNVYTEGTISAASSYVGGLVGYLNGGTITSCQASGTIESTSDSVGGLVGYSDNATIVSSSSDANVVGTKSVGGIVGQGYGQFTSVYSSGTITATDSTKANTAGGIVGYIDGGTTIQNSYTKATVSDGGAIAGLVSSGYTLAITNSQALSNNYVAYSDGATVTTTGCSIITAGETPFTISAKKTAQATGATTFGQMGLDSNALVTIVSNGTESVFTVETGTTLDQFQSHLQGKGFTTDFTNGILTISGANGVYIKGDLDDSIDAVLKFEDVDNCATVETSGGGGNVTTIGTAQSSSVIVTYTTTTTANTESTLAELGITEYQLNVYNSDGTLNSDYSTMLNSGTKVQDIINHLGSAGITATLANGVLNITSSADGRYIQGGLAEAMGISVNEYSGETVTTGTTLTSATPVTYTKTGTATGNSKLSEILSGMTTNEIRALTIFDNDEYGNQDEYTLQGYAQSLYSKNAEDLTINELLGIFEDLDYTATLSGDGRITITSNSDDWYITGTLADALGIGLSSVVTTTTAAVDQTSSAQVTYTKTVAISGTTEISEFYTGTSSIITVRTSSGSAIHMKTDGLTALSSVTASDMVSGRTYKISTTADLQALATIVNGGTNCSGVTFVMANDIDLSSIENWTAIGTSSQKFQGIFDGNGYEITGLNIDSTSNYQGLFGNIYGATIKNLGITGYEISGRGYVGALAGYASSSTITNVYTEGTISATASRVGGLVGYLSSGTITSCQASGTIESTSYDVGGLVGYSNNATIVSSSSDANVVGTYNVGGIVGNGFSQFTSVYSSGTITATNSTKANTAGGILGYIGGGTTIQDSYTKATVSSGGGAIAGSVISSYTLAITNSQALSDNYVAAPSSKTTITGCSVLSAGETPFTINPIPFGNIDITGMTVDEMFSALSSYGVTGTVSADGVLSFTSPSGNVISGEPAEAWGITTSSVVTTSTVAIDQTSTAQVMYTSTQAISATTEISELYTGTDSIITVRTSDGSAIHMKTDGLTALSSVTASAMVSGRTYKISTTADLQALATIVNDNRKTCSGVTFVLANDIDLSSISSWTAIGGSSGSFQGIFDGNGYEITGLNIDSTSNYQGLFGTIGRATIKNLGITGYEINGAGYVGALAGQAQNSTIINVYTDGTISATGIAVGGLVGYFDNGGTIIGCKASGTIESTLDGVGGLVGYGSRVTITSSSTDADVKGDYDIGGIVGRGYGKFTSVYSLGTITSTRNSKNCGGIIGSFMGNTTIQDSYTKATVSSGGAIAGVASSTLVIINTQALSDNYVASLNANTTITGCSVIGADETPFTINPIPFGIDITGMTVGQMFDALSAYDVTGSLNDGVISFTSTAGNYVTGAVMDAWGIGTSVSGSAETIANKQTSSSVITYNTTANITGTSLISNTYDLTDNKIVVKSGDGQTDIGTVTITSTMTFNNLFTKLGSLGVDGTLSNGVIKFTSDDGYYVTGGAITAWGIGTTSTTESTTTVFDQTSSVTVTYSNTVAISGTTEISEFYSGTDSIITVRTSYGSAIHKNVDSLTVLSAVTASDMVSGATFKISTTADLLKLATIVNGGTDCSGVTFVMANDIDLSSVNNWTPIGNSSTKLFKGVFDGNGYEISFLKIDATSDYQGLFGSLYGAVVKNLGISNYDIKNTGAYTAVLAGRANSATIQNVYVSGSIESSGNYVGGLIGWDYGSVITSCHVSGTITGGYQVGGLVGYAQNNITIVKSASKADIVGNYNVGGIAGSASGTLISVYSLGTISSTNSYYTVQVGGLVGVSDRENLTIQDSYSKATVPNSGGSLVGSISSSYTLSIINSNALTNNYVASPNGNTTITNCSTITVSSTQFTINPFVDSVDIDITDMTVDEMFSALSTYGVTGSLSSDGVISFTSSDGNIVTGAPVEAWGITTDDIVYNSITSSGTLTAATTWKDLGANGDVELVLYNVSTQATTTITIENSTTMARTALALSDYNIGWRASGGKLTVDYQGDYVIDTSNSTLLQKLGLSTDNHYNITVTTVCSNTRSNTVKETIRNTILGTTTLDKIGYDSGDSSVWTILNKTTGATVTIKPNRTGTLNNLANTLSAYDINLTVNNGKVIIESTGNYAISGISGWGSAELGLPANSEAWVTVNDTSVTYNTSSNNLNEEKTFTLDENTTWADLGFELGEYIYFHNIVENGSIGWSCNSSLKVAESLSNLYDIDAQVVDGKLQIQYNGDYVLELTSEQAARLNLNYANHYTVNSTTTYSNTTEDVVANSVVTEKTLSEDTTWADLGFTANTIIGITNLNTGQNSILQITTSATFAETAQSLYDQYGIQLSVTDGIVKIDCDNSTSGDRYILNNGIFNRAWGNSINVDLTNPTTVNTTTTWSNTTSDSLTANVTKTLNEDTTFGELGLDSTETLEIVNNGATTTVTVNASTTMTDFMNSLTGFNCFIADGKITIDGGNGVYIKASNSEIFNLLNITSNTTYTEDIKTGYANGSSSQMTKNTTAILTTETTFQQLGVVSDNNEIVVNKNGVASTITIDSTDTVGSLVTQLNNAMGTGAAEIRDGKFYLNTIDGAYISSIDSDIANALKISTNSSDYSTEEAGTSATTITSGQLKVLGEGSKEFITVDTELGDIIDSEGNPLSDYILDLGDAGSYTFDANTTIQDVIDRLQEDGITASLDNGVLTITANGNMTLGGGLGSFIAGSNPTINVTPGEVSENVEYAGSTLNVSTTTPADITEATKLVDIEIGGEKIVSGTFKVVLDGVTHNIATTDDTKIQDLLDALGSIGVTATLDNVTGGKAINISYGGNISMSDGASSTIVKKLFPNEFNQSLDSTSKVLDEVTENVNVVNVDSATELRSIYPGGTSVAEEVKVTIGEGSTAVTHTITILETETMGSLMQKFEDIGLVTTLWDGKLTVNARDEKVEIDSSSKLFNNLNLSYSDNLNITSSSEDVEKTIVVQVEASDSVATKVDINTVISSLAMNNCGTFSILRDDVKATFTINSDTTFQDLANDINSRFNDVVLEFDAEGRLKIYSTEGADVKAGISNDTSKFLGNMSLNYNGKFVESSRTMFNLSSSTKVTEDGIFVLGKVTEGSFIVGNAEITIDANTTLDDIIKQINSSADSNATAYWDSSTGQFSIKSRVSGAGYINIEAGTSNFTDIMGFTTTERDADGNIVVGKINTNSQLVGSNAEFFIDGTRYVSSSNIVGSDITKIEGVTLDLKDVSNGETVTVTIEKNYNAAADAMQEVVDAYNALIENVDKELSAEGDLKGESTLKYLRNQIRSLMMGSIGGTSMYNSLSSIGISTEAASAANISVANINKLEFNKDKFIEAFRNDSQAVEQLLVGNGVQQGIFTRVENVVESSVKAVTGYFASAERSYTTQIERLDVKIEKANAAVATYKARLEQKFQYMDMMISKMQEQFSTFLGT